MKSIWSNLVPRDAECRQTQGDNDVDITTPRTFCINIRSIRCLPKVDQIFHFPPGNTEEPVSASLIPKATENFVGKAFLETWFNNHGYLSPDIDIICLEFTIVGQTQLFESVHQIVNDVEFFLFSPNRPSTEQDRPSLLEVRIREYSNESSKKGRKTLSKEVVAVRSRTWPSKMESWWGWSRAAGTQNTGKESHDRPIVRLHEQGCFVDTLTPLVDSDEVNEYRGGEWKPLVQHASEDASGNGVPAKPRTTPIATQPDSRSPRDDSTELQDAISSEHPYIGCKSDKRNLIDPTTQTAKDAELAQILGLNQDHFDLDARLDGKICKTSERQFAPSHLILPHALTLDDGLRTVKFTIEHQDENAPYFTNSPDSDGVRMICATPGSSGRHNSYRSGEILEAAETQMPLQSRRASQQPMRSGRIPAFFLDTDDSQADHMTRSSSLLDSTSRVIDCNSIIRDISRADGSLAQNSEQPGESGIGTTRGDDHGCLAQEVSSPGLTDHEEIKPSAEKPQGGARATVRKAEIPSIAEPQCPAGRPNAVSSLLRDGGDPDTPETQYENVAKTTHSHVAAEFDSREEAPGGSNEMGTCQSCQGSDQASIQSADSEGLPFPDDYWIYDEKAKNYYHVEVGDDETETISWYPLEFD
ncbi:hypothetical protein G7054_g1648 [Neopestalotiopsis clavispora]|nr:hypothetical protein G7054_g1648 [Neopestalotiopsis clavispora]